MPHVTNYCSQVFRRVLRRISKSQRKYFLGNTYVCRYLRYHENVGIPERTQHTQQETVEGKEYR